jgi:V/A-type H+-transporting ATPase subunit A
LLQHDRELREVAGLVGPDALEDRDRLVLESARLLRDLLIGQSTYDEADASSPLGKTHALAAMILGFHRAGCRAIEGGGTIGGVDVGRARRAINTIRDRRDGGSAEERAVALQEVMRSAGGAG